MKEGFPTESTPDPEIQSFTFEVGPEKAMEAFQNERLLVRMLENPSVERGTEGVELNFRTHRRELELLETNGLNGASSTLIVPDHGITLYADKAAGLLFDGNESEIIHVADKDSGSSGSSAEDFRANDSNIHNLSELASLIKETVGKSPMNEVNANFDTKGLVGILVRKAGSSLTMMQGIMTQRYMGQKGYHLPLFIYDQDHGTLTPSPYTGEKTEEYIALSAMPEKLKGIYSEGMEHMRDE
jgi:hypothetical protein